MKSSVLMRYESMRLVWFWSNATNCERFLLALWFELCGRGGGGAVKTLARTTQRKPPPVEVTTPF